MRPAKNMAKDLGRLVFWYPFRWLAQMLPMRMVPLYGSVLGAVDLHLSGRTRVLRMKRNIKRALECDSHAVDRILLSNLQSHGMNMIEFMKYPQIDAAASNDMVIWDNREALDAALAEGTGVLLLTAHFGAKQFLQVALGNAGYPVSQINYHLEGERLSWIQQRVAQKQRMRIENSIPCHFISAKSFLRDAFRCLKQNELLIVASDGVGVKELMDESFRPFSFLCQTMRFPTNYAVLAKHTGATMVPCFVVREGFKHRVVFHPALDIDKDPVSAYVGILEDHVTRYPHLWEFWEEFEQGELLV